MPSIFRPLGRSHLDEQKAYRDLVVALINDYSSGGRGKRIRGVVGVETLYSLRNSAARSAEKKSAAEQLIAVLCGVMTFNHSSSIGDAAHPHPKQAAVVDDSLFPMPRAKLTARDILDQAGASKDVVLQRDYNSIVDQVFADDELVDLREGNVFKTLPRCAPAPCRDAHAKPKLAFVVDDVWKVTVTASQTGHSLKRLLGLPDGVTLFRDFESPSDEPIGDSTPVAFTDGPVFTAKRALSYCINIEGKNYDWSKATITTAEIRALGNLPADQQVVCEDAEGRERTLREDEVVTLDPCCRFGRAPKYKRG